MRVVADPQAPLSVLAAGDGWVVIDKPAGVPVHPLLESEGGTVLNAAIAGYPEMQGVGEGGLRSGVVHRLDIETSGALVLATRQEAWEKLREEFRTHRAEKIYRAIVMGRVGGSGRTEMNLLISQHRPAKVRVVEEMGHAQAGTRRCGLSWKVVERLAGATLVEVRLETGFLHQIRVMFAQMGHAVAGDGLYGGEEAAGFAGAPRQMLHAAFVRAGLAMGRSGDPLDFAGCLERLRE